MTSVHTIFLEDRDCSTAKRQKKTQTKICCCRRRAIEENEARTALRPGCSCPWLHWTRRRNVSRIQNLPSQVMKHVCDTDAWFQQKSEKARHGGTTKQESGQLGRWLPRNAVQELTNNKDLPVTKNQRDRTSFSLPINCHYTSHSSAVVGTALFLQIWKPLCKPLPQLIVTV